MRSTLRPLSLSDADLERLGDDELAALEDRLLLNTELDLSLDSQFTRGRAVVLVLTLLGVGTSLSLYSRLPTQKLGPLNIPLYLVAFGLGAAAAHWLWSAAGRGARETVRWLLGYWPLLLYLGAELYRYSHSS